MSAQENGEGTTIALPPIEPEVKSRAESFLANLREGVKKKYSRKREGIHISDLTGCPRKVVFNDMNKLDLTNNDLNFFTSGSAIGAALESAAEEDKERYTTEQFCHIGHFINGHIDIYDKIDNMPIEFKTYRGRTTDKLPKVHQVDQLKSYMVAMNASKGLIVYQMLNKFNGSPWEIFEVQMTPEERLVMERMKIEDGLLLARARALKLPALARHVMNDKDMNWMCKDCPFKEACMKLNQESELQ